MGSVPAFSPVRSKAATEPAPYRFGLKAQPTISFVEAPRRQQIVPIGGNTWQPVALDFEHVAIDAVQVLISNEPGPLKVWI